MTTSLVPIRVLATLQLVGLSVPAFLQVAQRILAAMTGNPSFPAPVPPLSTLSAAIAALNTAETVALSRARGTAAVRDEKRLALLQVLLRLKAYVQGVAEADPASAAGIIESAGMGLRRRSARKPRVFGLSPGPVSGTVNVIAPAAAQRASYDWQYSVDGGETWVSLISTLQARTTITGLQPGAVVLARYRAITKSGATDWSAPASITVA